MRGYDLKSLATISIGTVDGATRTCLAPSVISYPKLRHEIGVILAGASAASPEVRVGRISADPCSGSEE